MALTVSATANATSEIAAAATHGDGLRIMSVSNAPEYFNVSTPQTNLSTSIPWSKPSSANVPDMSAMCYYFGVEQVHRHPSQPVGMIASAWGGTDVQVWMSPRALARCAGAQQQHKDEKGDQLLKTSSNNHQLLQTSSNNPDIGLGYIGSELGGGSCPTVPSTLYNAMIAPLLPLRVEGWLWVRRPLHGVYLAATHYLLYVRVVSLSSICPVVQYQGESNAGAPNAYQCQFPSKIEQWRADWHGANVSTPYIFVQLAPWPAHDVGLIAVQRYAQLAALKLPNVGMVVGADIGDPAGKYHPIHPPW